MHLDGDVQVRTGPDEDTSEPLRRPKLRSWLRNFLEDRLEMLRGDENDEPETLSYVLDFVVEYVSYTKVSSSNRYT
jgi:hypothetical protein